MTGVDRVHSTARRSLASVAFTTAAITANHLYILEFKALILGALLIGLSTAFLLWFRRGQSTTALAGYVLTNLWIVIGFGLY